MNDRPKVTAQEAYPPLDSVVACRKCGQEILGPEDAHMQYGCVTESGNARPTVINEWIKRTCTCCGYSWREGVLEAGL